MILKLRRLALFWFAVHAALGCSWDYPIWIPKSANADPLYRFTKDEKAGYIDANGVIVMPPTMTRYGNVGFEFHDGLLEVSVGGGKYIDRTGKVALEPGLDRGWEFSEGLAAAMWKGEQLWGFIDTTGKFVIEPRFPSHPDGYVSSFSDGMAVVQVKGRYGAIDRSGAFVIPPRFFDLSSFTNGFARVVIEGPCIYIPDGPCGSYNLGVRGTRKGNEGKSEELSLCRFTFIDKSGKVISSKRFDRARDFSEGLAPVQVGELWGYLDRTGSMAIPPRFADAEPFSLGLARVKIGDLYGYIDKSGDFVIKPQFEVAESFSDGLAVVGERYGPSWYIRRDGERAFEGDFALASPFFKGLAHVEFFSGDAGNHAYIDTSGKVVFRY
jgi:hypothetical protein